MTASDPLPTALHADLDALAAAAVIHGAPVNPAPLHTLLDTLATEHAAMVALLQRMVRCPWGYDEHGSHVDLARQLLHSMELPLLPRLPTGDPPPPPRAPRPRNPQP